MIKQITLFIIEQIKKNGSISVFLGGVIEQIMGVLIPSPLVPMSAGFLLIPQNKPFISAIISILSKISLPYAIGASLGASLFYFIAKYGGRTLIDKYGRFFGVSLKDIDKFRNRFTRGYKDEILLFLLLILPVTSISLVSATCGVIGIIKLEFFTILVTGIFFRSFFLAFLGWKVGETYELFSNNLDKTQSFVSVIILGVIFLSLAFLYYKREKFFKN